MITVTDVTDLLGVQRSADQVTAALATVTALARSYTRGVGWYDEECEPDINAVILTATLRLLANPGQLPVSEGMGAFTVDVRGGFSGWSLVELAVLDRYRRKAL